MATVTTAEGAAALINFLVNGTVSSADAANSAMQALSSSGISADAIISATGAIADVGGIGASSVQMFQQFASNSAKAGALAGAVATSAAGLSVAASAASMVKSVYQNGFGSLTASQFDALSATLLAAGAIVAAPEAAIALGVLAAGMTAFGWSKQANDTTVSSALAQLQGIVQKYYASLSSSDQATFNSSLGNAMQSTLSGGMMVPQVNGTGEITGYAADVPVSVVPQSDGSTLYTFSSGVTYSQGSAATFGPLVVPSGSAGENVWTIPQSGTTDPVKLGIYGEGSYSDIFKDSQGNAVAEVYIAGTSGTYSIAPTSGAQFINDVGSGNQVVATAGSFIDLKGGNNTAQVSGATVLAGSDVTSTINGDNDTVDAGSGSRAVLYGTSDVVNLVANGGSLVNIMQANSSDTVNGAGNIVGILASGDNVTASGETFNFSAGGFTTRITGNGDIINAGSSSGTLLYGTGDIVNFYANSGSLVNIMQGNSSDTVNGAGNTVGILGSGDNVTASGDTFNFSAGGFATAITGNGDIINAGGGSGTLLYGTGDIVNFYANSGSLVNIMQANSSDTVNGAGNTVGILGSGDNVTASGDTFNFSAGGFTTAITGNGDIINAGGGSGTLLYGTGDIVNFYANSGSLVNIMQANSSDTVNGAGNTVGILGSGDNVTASGDTFNFSAGGFATAITGNGDIINAGGGSGTLLYGTGDIVNFYANSGSLVNIMQGNSSDTVNGAGNTVGILGAGDNVTASGDTFNFSVGGFTTAITGNSDIINAGGGSSTVLYGTDDIVNLIANSGSLVNIMQGNSSETVNGAGNTIGVLASGDSVAASGDTINSSSGTSFNLSGGNDTVSLGGTGDYLGLLGGAYSVSGTGATINTWAGTSVNLSGGNDTVGLGGSGDYLGLLGGSGYSVTATSATINTWGGTTFNLSGNNDTVGLGGTGDYLGLLGGTYLVNGSGDTINTWNNTSVALSGSGNTLGLGASSALSVTGDGNTIGMGSGSSLVDDGINNTINASGSEIVIGAINRNQTIYIYGNNDYIDASAVSDYIHTTIEVIGTGNTVRAEADTINFQGDGNSVLGGYNNLLGSYAHQVSSLPSNLNTFPGVPVSVGSPASGSTDSDGVQTYPVETPPITVTPLDETQTQACPNGTDPIILNLNGGAVDTTSLASSSTSFDMQNDGHKVQTAWGTAGEGYLVFDPNDAGNTMAVTQDSQLVAGFGALQALAQQVDGSGSGTLTASDALWNSLKVWVDTTGSGQFQSGELYSLSQLGITSLDLDGTQVNRDSNGNEILVDSTFTRADGSTGDIAGVNLMYNADATASASTVQTSASLADLQISNLIAGMASYGAQPAASSTLVATAQRDPHTILAASLH